MKIVANPEIKKAKCTEFPCIMKWTGSYDNGLVVLFVAKDTGVVLLSGANINRTGEFKDNWNGPGEGTNWVPYEGSVTISNN